MPCYTYVFCALKTCFGVSGEQVVEKRGITRITRHATQNSFGSYLKKVSNFLRPSPSVVQPTDQTMANRKAPSSSCCLLVSSIVAPTHSRGWRGEAFHKRSRKGMKQELSLPGCGCVGPSLSSSPPSLTGRGCVSSPPIFLPNFLPIVLCWSMIIFLPRHLPPHFPVLAPPHLS